MFGTRLRENDPGIFDNRSWTFRPLVGRRNFTDSPVVEPFHLFFQFLHFDQPNSDKTSKSTKLRLFCTSIYPFISNDLAPRDARHLNRHTVFSLILSVQAERHLSVRPNAHSWTILDRPVRPAASWLRRISKWRVRDL